MEPWEALRALRARPLVAATAGDEEISGGDAVDELGAIRELLDAPLAHPANGCRGHSAVGPSR